MSFGRSSNYYDDKHRGGEWQRIVERTLTLVPFVKWVRWDKDSVLCRNLQRLGIEDVIRSRMLMYETKSRDARWCCRDFFLETVSVPGSSVSREVKGWYYATGAMAILYGWVSSDERRSLDAYLINISKLRNMGFAEKIIEERGESIARQTVKGSTAYTSHGIVVSIDDFPLNTVFHIGGNSNFEVPSNGISLAQRDTEEQFWKVFDNNMVNRVYQKIDT